ncbi:hypothetical protein JCM14076_15390 [Methylosoma difficile]
MRPDVLGVRSFYAVGYTPTYGFLGGLPGQMSIYSTRKSDECKVDSRQQSTISKP